jgi:hypothetical protein
VSSSLTISRWLAAALLLPALLLWRTHAFALDPAVVKQLGSEEVSV